MRFYKGVTKVFYQIYKLIKILSFILILNYVSY